MGDARPGGLAALLVHGASSAQRHARLRRRRCGRWPWSPASRPARQLIAGALLAGLAIGHPIADRRAHASRSWRSRCVRRRDLRAAGGAAGAIRGRRRSSGRCRCSSRAAALPAISHALSFQAGADFGGTSSCCGSHHTARAVAHALMNTFIWPWDWWLGLAVCALAAAGALRIAWRAPLVRADAARRVRALRDLPSAVPGDRDDPLRDAAAAGHRLCRDGGGRRPAGAGAAGRGDRHRRDRLMQAVPASVHYAREGAPVFRAFDDMAATAHGGDRVDTIGDARQRAARRRVGDADPARAGRQGAARARVAHARRAVEGRARRRASGSSPIPTAATWRCSIRARAIWRAPTAGVSSSRRSSAASRPASVDWYHMQPPNWMLDRGWSVTAEVGGVSARDKAGPPLTPAIAWLKRQPQETTARARRTASRRRHGARHAEAGRPRRSRRSPLPAGFFLRLLTLPAGAWTPGPAYVPLAVTSVGHVSARAVRRAAAGRPDVRLRHRLGRAGVQPRREAGLAVDEREGGRCGCVRSAAPVTLRLAGESPLRYFDAAPRVRVLIGDREVAAFDPVIGFRSGHHAARRSARPRQRPRRPRELEVLRARRRPARRTSATWRCGSIEWVLSTSSNDDWRVQTEDSRSVDCRLSIGI